MRVKLIRADEKGRLRLSLKAALAEEGGTITPIAQAGEAAPAPAAGSTEQQ